MRMVDIIEKKRDGGVLSEEEIRFFIEGYTKGDIPDYQASALAMAILFKGMNKKEIAILTDAMEHSGNTIDLSCIAGVKVDKHSTGGVGDKTSLALGPLVAACGAKLAKMSGRGLGHTGGTLDKMESIPGLRVSMDEEQFINQVNKIGIAIIGQTQSIVPADKKLYALRDVTGTVESIPLIAASIMSKKLASGSNTILLDVKFGSGAFMKTYEKAKELAVTMVEIGDSLGRDARAIITDMNQPLGLAVGNIVEVKEAIDTLNGKGPKDFVELVRNAGGIILTQAGIANNYDEGVSMIDKAIEDRSGLKKLRELVEAQGGDATYVDDPDKFPVASNVIPVVSSRDGYIRRIDSLSIGLSAMRLGAGRETLTDVIDTTAGIVLTKKVGDYVKNGDVIAYAHTNKADFSAIICDIENSFEFADAEFVVDPIIHAIIEK